MIDKSKYNCLDCVNRCLKRNRRKDYHPDRTYREIPIFRWHFIIEIVAITLWILVLYFCFTHFMYLLSDKETHASYVNTIFVLPIIYYLRDKIFRIFNSISTNVSISDKSNEIIVNQGFISEFQDSLDLENMENIELYKGFFGKIFNYGNLVITVYGNQIHLENIMHPQCEKKRIYEIVKIIKDKNRDNK